MGVFLGDINSAARPDIEPAHDVYVEGSVVRHVPRPPLHIVGLAMHLYAIVTAVMIYMPSAHNWKRELSGVHINGVNSRQVMGLRVACGEGSLLAAAGSLMGVGTDLAGSVRVQAAYCGALSHNSTYGVVPNTGLLPDDGENLEQYNFVGLMCRFAEDLSLMLNVLAKYAANRLKLNKKGNLKHLKVHYMDTEGSLYISPVTTEATRAAKRVTDYLRTAHGIEPKRLYTYQRCGS
ncbi:fatty-acid amide hydrolase 2-like [Rhipicephalus microplus]|uniref:fatty-acid amide hydrolase 2-like n=1 Tax=Rhipicephalus microplus TaxID=6941 RepID=UPI003F6C6D77